MKTDALIVQLAQSARPIRPLAPPGLRAARFLVAALLVMSVVIVMVGPRDDIASALGRPVFLASLAALLLMLMSGASTAFVLSVPGAEGSAAQRIVPLLAVASWSAIWMVSTFAGDASAGETTAPFHLACALTTALCAVAIGALLLTMIVRAAPLRTLHTALTASLASTAAGAAVAQVFCPLDDATHQLVGHVLIAVAVMAAGMWVGRQMLETRMRHRSGGAR